MYRFYCFLIIFLMILICDCQARYCFISVGYIQQYDHGKNLNEARKHYKENWTFLQRFFWIPIFKEKYKNNFRLMAYFSYIQYVWAILTYLCFILSDLYFPKSILWLYVFIAFLFFSLISFFHSDHICRYCVKKKKKRK